MAARLLFIYGKMQDGFLSGIKPKSKEKGKVEHVNLKAALINIFRLAMVEMNVEEVHSELSSDSEVPLSSPKRFSIIQLFVLVFHCTVPAQHQTAEQVHEDLAAKEPRFPLQPVKQNETYIVNH